MEFIIDNQNIKVITSEDGWYYEVYVNGELQYDIEILENDFMQVMNIIKDRL